MVDTTGSKLPVGHTPQQDDIVFTQVVANWVHHPHKDTMVIIAEVANSLVYRWLVDRGTAVCWLFN